MTKITVVVVIVRVDVGQPTVVVELGIDTNAANAGTDRQEQAEETCSGRFPARHFRSLPALFSGGAAAGFAVIMGAVIPLSGGEQEFYICVEKTCIVGRDIYELQ